MTDPSIHVRSTISLGSASCSAAPERRHEVQTTCARPLPNSLTVSWSWMGPSRRKRGTVATSSTITCNSWERRSLLPCSFPSIGFEEQRRYTLRSTVPGQLENHPHRRGTEIAFLQPAVVGVAAPALRQHDQLKGD